MFRHPVGTEERTGGGRAVGPVRAPLSVAGLEFHPDRFVVAPRTTGCYGFGEMPSPNHKGRRTSGGSHGDDTESDGVSLAGPQPYEGDKRKFPRCVAGSLRVRGGTSKASLDAEIPWWDSSALTRRRRSIRFCPSRCTHLNSSNIYVLEPL